MTFVMLLICLIHYLFHFKIHLMFLHNYVWMPPNSPYSPLHMWLAQQDSHLIVLLCIHFFFGIEYCWHIKQRRSLGNNPSHCIHWFWHHRNPYCQVLAIIFWQWFVVYVAPSSTWSSEYLQLVDGWHRKNVWRIPLVHHQDH